MNEMSKPLFKVADKLGELLLEKAPGAATDAYKKLRLVVDKGLPTYLEAHNTRCEFIRTLLNRDKPVAIEKAFVEPSFKVAGVELTTEDVLVRIGEGTERTIITGIAGSGKSVFLKYAFRKVIERGDTYYPIFFELRDLNKTTQGNLDVERHIFESIAKFCDGFTVAQFRFGMKRGAFYFLMDGYDEVAPALRTDFEEGLCELARKYPHCPIVMSSRPSEEFTSWEGFTRTHLQPFSQDQAVEFIGKIQFDQARKDEFLEALKTSLYDKHTDFLSNPLLASMMLLTYDEYGDIPAKRHIFFEKCFQVLLREHDVSKGRYRRQFYTGLEYHEIENLFMFFCTYSYLDRAFSFNNDKMRQYTIEAVEAASLSVDASDVVKDFVESLSIIQQDGSHFEFAHRSFQEYFFAKFVVIDREHSLPDKLSELGSLWSFDDTVAMISEMNYSYFCYDFVLPEAKRLKVVMDKVDLSKRPSTILAKLFDDIRFMPADAQNGYESVRYLTEVTDKNKKRSWARMVWGEATKRNSIRERLPAKQDATAIPKDALDELRARESVPVHHMNDAIFIALGCDNFAERIRVGISLLIKELESEKQTRKSRLATRMRSQKV